MYRRIVEFEKWRLILNQIVAGRSIIVHGGRFHGKSWLCESARRKVGESRHLVLFDPHDYREEPQLGEKFFDLYWSKIVEALGLNDLEGKRCGDGPSFIASVLELLRLQNKPLTLIQRHRRGSEVPSFRLAASLHSLLVESEFENLPLSVTIVDDFSLFYYGLWEAEAGISALTAFRPHFLGGLSREDLEAVLAPQFKGRRAESLSVVEGIIEMVWRLTGGHPGLTAMVLEELPPESGEMMESDFGNLQARVKNIVSRSYVLEGIHRGLADEPGIFSRVAEDFESTNYSGELVDPYVQYLVHLGVLDREGPTRAKLYEGAISELVLSLKDRDLMAVSDVARERPASSSELLRLRSRIRTVDTLGVEDGDFVVAHVSDLHVGERFPFRLSKGGRADASRPSIGRLMREDVERLGVSGRINAVIFSGDFTETGALEEFLRAKEIVEEILAGLGIERKSMLVVAGNHDLQWKPSELAEYDSRSGASRQGYCAFRELLGFGSDNQFDILDINASSGDGGVLRVMTLDSNWIEGPETGGIGYVAPTTLEEAEDRLKEVRSCRGEEMALWLVVHHHVFPATSTPQELARRRSISTLANASQLLSFASRWGVEAVLHGHEHQPSVTAADRWPNGFGANSGSVVSIGVGSLCGAREILAPFSRNHYFMLQRTRDGRLIVRSRFLGDSGLAFASHQDIVLNMPLGESK